MRVRLSRCAPTRARPRTRVRPQDDGVLMEPPVQSSTGDSFHSDFPEEEEVDVGTIESGHTTDRIAAMTHYLETMLDNKGALYTMLRGLKWRRSDIETLKGVVDERIDEVLDLALNRVSDCANGDFTFASADYVYLTLAHHLVNTVNGNSIAEAARHGEKGVGGYRLRTRMLKCIRANPMTPAVLSVVQGLPLPA
jgi:hypothetical protein